MAQTAAQARDLDEIIWSFHPWSNPRAYGIDEAKLRDLAGDILTVVAETGFSPSEGKALNGALGHTSCSSDPDLSPIELSAATCETFRALKSTGRKVAEAKAVMGTYGMAPYGRSVSALSTATIDTLKHLCHRPVKDAIDLISAYSNGAMNEHVLNLATVTCRTLDSLGGRSVSEASDLILGYRRISDFGEGAFALADATTATLDYIRRTGLQAFALVARMDGVKAGLKRAEEARYQTKVADIRAHYCQAPVRWFQLGMAWLGKTDKPYCAADICKSLTAQG